MNSTPLPTVRRVAGKVGDIQLSDLINAGLAPIANPALTGTPTAPTATNGTNTAQLATCAFVQTALTGVNNLALGNTIGGSPTAGTVLYVGTNGVLAQATGISIAGTVLTVGRITSPGTGNQSERFGANASASADGATAVGNSATASAVNASAVGQGAVASGVNSLAVGVAAHASGSASTAIGVTASASGTNAFALGQGATANFDYSLAVGESAVAAFTQSIAIGVASASTAANQCVVGGAAIPINMLTLGGAVAIADNTVPNRTFFISSDPSHPNKLCWKDLSGTVQPLY